ncbi:hypothetical protein BOX15_Mlig011398g1 [Macrostomum lignano]|uniref:LIM zinc-binding domain-containing protein n=1 Tax=Macrostomum lignano TaxID=282301 RepID=A0A267EUL3_9PLAT|nr:hypothetical protein BOX15_Mlig011398g2 [Macrostomum lignano]PAA65233.1 hypothetical protein BOX15_Mlig011398g1 [Macrostomum lignano]
MSSGNGSVGQGQGGGADSCKMCHGRVYPMERLTSDGQVYHKSCYRCYKCKRQLSVGNFAIMDDRLYCQPHYIELFRLKGSYRFHDSAGVPVNSIAGSGDESVENGGGSNDSGHVPKLSNIKSRFESFEEQPPASPSKRKEKVYYAGLQSARHRYETATSEKERPHSEKPKRFTPPREGSAGVVESQPQELPPDVVRCYDNGDSDDRPAPGSSRNVLARFREIEQQNGSHQPPAKEAEARPRSPPVSKPQQPRQQQQQLDFDYSAPVSDATVSESQPTPLPDGVVRSGAPDPADELPPANAARSALQLWRGKEEEVDASGAPNPETAERRQRELRDGARQQRQAAANRNVRLPQRQEPQRGDGDDEGDGEIVGEGVADELPAEGTARSLRSLFDGCQQQQQAA